MKRTSIIIILAVLLNGTVHAQLLKPVKWSYAAKKISATEAVIFMKATIETGWHIYSLNVPDGGPIKTSFTFSPSKSYILSGKPMEPKPVTKFEKTFNMNVSYFENSVIFQQRIKLRTSSPTVKGKLEYMVCSDRQCLPPEEIAFSVPVK